MRLGGMKHGTNGQKKAGKNRTFGDGHPGG